MICPACGSSEHRALRADHVDRGTRRTRECKRCGKRWRTLEVTQEEYARTIAVLDAYERLRLAVVALDQEP